MKFPPLFCFVIGVQIIVIRRLNDKNNGKIWLNPV